jgi:single-strand DNA-binding protein
MSANNVNVATITGNLTRDPEHRATAGGTSLCEMRVAVNTPRRNAQTGQWEDKANYFDVVVFGGQADSCATYLHKGRPVAIAGRLDWQEWEARDGSGKRQAVKIIADTVQFLGARDGGKGSAPGKGEPDPYTPPGAPDFSKDPPPGAVPDFGPVGAGQEDDIPF